MTPFEAQVDRELKKIEANLADQAKQTQQKPPRFPLTRSLIVSFLGALAGASLGQWWWH